MNDKKLKNTLGILSLISSLLFVVLSPISFLVLFLLLGDTGFEVVSFLVFVFALYYLVISIKMLLKFKTKEKLIKTVIQNIFSNLISVTIFFILILKNSFFMKEEISWAEVFIIFIAFNSGGIYLVVMSLIIVLSLVNIVLSILYIKPYVKMKKEEVKETLKDHKDHIKQELDDIKSYKEGNFEYIEKEIKYENENMFDENTKYKIYMAAKKLYDLGEYKKSLTYFKKISNYKDVYKYIIDIESLINIE